MRQTPTNVVTSGMRSIFSSGEAWGAFDGRCSLRSWALRVAHNTAASYVISEWRMNSKLVSFEEIERTLKSVEQEIDEITGVSPMER